MSMGTSEIRARLELCAAEMERGIEAWRTGPHWGVADDVPLERLLDTNGRPILAELYADLGQIYAALAALGA